jgi:hypothetical protein
LPVRCRVGVGAAAPRPIRFGAPSPLCSTIKPASPSPLSTVALLAFSASHSFCRRAILLSRPAPACCGAPAPCSVRQSPLLRHLNYDLGPLSILPRSTPLWWPPVPIRLAPRSRLPRRRPRPHYDVDGMPGYPRRRLPARALALKSASMPPSSRPSEPIDPLTTSLLRPRRPINRVSTTKGRLQP